MVRFAFIDLFFDHKTSLTGRSPDSPKAFARAVTMPLAGVPGHKQYTIVHGRQAFQTR